MLNDNPTNEVFKSLGEELNISTKSCEEVIDWTYEFIRKKIIEIPFIDMSIEDFDKAKKTFNVPGLFKFYPVRRSFININRLNKKDEEK